MTLTRLLVPAFAAVMLASPALAAQGADTQPTPPIDAALVGEPSDAPAASSLSADEAPDVVEPHRRPGEHPMSMPKEWRKRLRMSNPTREDRKRAVA